MSPAADDLRTSAHERAKDRAFIGTILLAIALIGIGVVLIAQQRWWVFAGGLLFLMGLSFGAASVIGLIYRRKARRVLQTHDWVATAIKIVARPRSGRNGRTIIELIDPGVTLAVTGLAPEITNRIEREGMLEYAGDLSGTAMIFTRLIDGHEVYVAVVPRRHDKPGEATQEDA